MPTPTPTSNTLGGLCPKNPDGGSTDAYGQSVSADQVNQPGCTELTSKGTLSSGVKKLVNGSTDPRVYTKFYAAGGAYPVWVTSLPASEYDVCKNGSEDNKDACRRNVLGKLNSVVDYKKFYDWVLAYVIRPSGYSAQTEFGAASERSVLESVVLAPAKDASPLGHEWIVGCFPASGIPQVDLGFGRYAGPSNSGGINGGYLERTQTSEVNGGKPVFSFTAPENIANFPFRFDGTGGVSGFGNIASTLEMSVCGSQAMSQATSGLQGGVLEFMESFQPVGGDNRKGTGDPKTFTAAQLESAMASNGVVRDSSKSRKAWYPAITCVVQDGADIDQAIETCLDFAKSEQTQFNRVTRGLLTMQLYDESKAGGNSAALKAGTSYVNP